MTIRNGWDRAVAPANAPIPGPSVAFGYLHGGSATHGWEPDEWARVRSWAETTWLVPIFVCRPSDDPVVEASSACSQAAFLRQPKGTVIVYDIEQHDVAAAIANRCASRWAARVHQLGYVPVIYCSASSMAAIQREAPWVAIWAARWRSTPEPVPGAVMTQWYGGVGVFVDKTIVTLDALPLWENRAALPAPEPKVKPVISAKFPPVDVKLVDGHPVVLTSDGGVFAPQGGFYGSPVGQAYWAGRHASALAVAGDPQHPLTEAEVKSGKKYAVIATTAERYAFGPK